VENPILDTRLSESLSPAASQARKQLLIASAIGIAIATMKIVPNKISALGIEFNEINKTSFIYLMAATCCYLALSFITYATTDYLQWRSSVKQNYLAYGIRASMAGIGYKSNMAHGLASKLRVLVDYFLPLVISAISVYLLIKISAEI
jgi:hypothetical protein